jgi:hypothetical protein
VAVQEPVQLPFECESKTGPGARIAKRTVPLVPAPVVTLTFTGPGATLFAIVKVAVIWVALTTTTFVTVIPLPALTLAPDWKLVPVRVTGVLDPSMPAAGLIELTVGAPAPAVAAGLKTARLAAHLTPDD